MISLNELGRKTLEDEDAKEAKKVFVPPKLKVFRQDLSLWLADDLETKILKTKLQNNQLTLIRPGGAKWAKIMVHTTLIK